MKPFTAQIAGREHYKEAVLTPYSMIELVLAPCDSDPTAVAVLVDGVMAGHVELGLAPLIAPRLRRGGIVLAGPIENRTDEIMVYVGAPGDRLAGPHPTIMSVLSSGGTGGYAVDLRGGQCTCAANRWVICKHKSAFGIGA